jgi:hypothetical protein
VEDGNNHEKFHVPKVLIGVEADAITTSGGA